MLSIVWFIFNHHNVLPWDAGAYKDAYVIIYFASYNPYENLELWLFDLNRYKIYTNAIINNLIKIIKL